MSDEQVKIPNDLIEKIKQQSFRNIVAKVKAGKVLTGAETKMLDEMRKAGADVPDGPAEQTYPKWTKIDSKMREYIQENFDLSERKSYSWLTKLKGMKSSRGWPVEAMLTEIERRRESTGKAHDPDLKREKLQEEVWILRAKRLEVEGELVPVSEVRQEIRQGAQRVRSVAESWRNHNSAKYPNLVEMISALADEIILEMGEC